MVTYKTADRARELVFSYLPEGLGRELIIIGQSDREVRESLSELRLRSGSVSFAVCGKRSIPLSYRIAKEELEELRALIWQEYVEKVKTVGDVVKYIENIL